MNRLNLLVALAACCALAPVARADGAGASGPAVLTQPALVTPKTLNAAMLAIAAAGQRLVAAGERGSILYSDDAGVTWRQASVPVGVSLTAVQFIDARQGWAVGHQGVVLHSADGGATWSKQLDGIQAAALALKAAANVAGPDQARALADATHLVEDGPDKPFLDLHFASARSGYVLGAYNLLFKTDDGGATWQPWQQHVANPKGLHLYGMRGAGGALYLAGEQGLLLRSTDQGASFIALPTPYKGSFFGLLAARGGALLAYGLRGNAYWSGDQGASWSKVETGVQASLAGGAELADGTLVLVSQGGDVLLSRDQGRSFAAQTGAALPPALPLAAVAQAGDGALVVAGLRGLRRVAAPR
ncbi:MULTISPECIES: YCF48-related protein [unclassified Duganella]|uniref:YCF48-related protein n=1 Tax=unclassified Duganella TaxID=2636909 RepID=UPI000E352383|nr:MULTISPECIES: YCF48-related protein [unclassified Duganella]RFP19259.1 glycosyl hydrolase [Duganella sp. BJB475]RFP35840.1 glycosyl hydrolase [Duganella sp. BJB476]